MAESGTLVVKSRFWLAAIFVLSKKIPAAEIGWCCSVAGGTWDASSWAEKSRQQLSSPALESTALRGSTAAPVKDTSSQSHSEMLDKLHPFDN